MSTDIIKFQRTGPGGVTEKTISVGAINIFLAATLPLTFLTFVAWGLFYQFSKRKDRKEKEKRFRSYSHDLFREKEKELLSLSFSFLLFRLPLRAKDTDTESGKGDEIQYIYSSRWTSDCNR